MRRLEEAGQRYAYTFYWIKFACVRRASELVLILRHSACGTPPLSCACECVWARVPRGKGIWRYDIYYHLLPLRRWIGCAVLDSIGVHCVDRTHTHLHGVRVDAGQPLTVFAHVRACMRTCVCIRACVCRPHGRDSRSASRSIRHSNRSPAPGHAARFLITPRC